MNEPRPAMISARPPESRSSVAKSWKTRTGSSELSTVTALVSRMRFVRAAARQRDGRRGDGEVGTVVLADAEDVEAELVGQLDLLEQVAHPPLGRRRGAPGHGQLAEGVEAELHQTFPLSRLGSWAELMRCDRRGLCGHARAGRGQHRRHRPGALSREDGVEQPREAGARASSRRDSSRLRPSGRVRPRRPRAVPGSGGRAWPLSGGARRGRRTTRLFKRPNGGRSRAGQDRSGREARRKARAPRGMDGAALSWARRSVGLTHCSDG